MLVKATFIGSSFFAKESVPFTVLSSTSGSNSESISELVVLLNCIYILAPYLRKMSKLVSSNIYCLLYIEITVYCI